MKKPLQDTESMFVDSQQALFDFFYKFYGCVIDGEHIDPAPSRDTGLNHSGSDSATSLNDLSPSNHNRLRRTVPNTRKTTQSIGEPAGLS